MFEPLNKTVPPGIFSDTVHDVTQLKAPVEAVYREMIYDTSLPTFFGRTFPSFMSREQRDAMPSPRGGIAFRVMTVPYMEGAFLETVRANDAKLNPFTYPLSIVGEDENDFFPPGERNFFGTFVLNRSDITIKGMHENPIAVPPCQGGGGSERPDSGLLYPRKV